MGNRQNGTNLEIRKNGSSPRQRHLAPSAGGNCALNGREVLISTWAELNHRLGQDHVCDSHLAPCAGGDGALNGMDVVISTGARLDRQLGHACRQIVSGTHICLPLAPHQLVHLCVG